VPLPISLKPWDRNVPTQSVPVPGFSAIMLAAKVADPISPPVGAGWPPPPPTFALTVLSVNTNPEPPAVPPTAPLPPEEYPAGPPSPPLLRAMVELDTLADGPPLPIPPVPPLPLTVHRWSAPCPPVFPLIVLRHLLCERSGRFRRAWGQVTAFSSAGRRACRRRASRSDTPREGQSSDVHRPVRPRRSIRFAKQPAV
jgi:hypothetical protein